MGLNYQAISTNGIYVKINKSLFRKIGQIQIYSNQKQVSFDALSLFSNIPQDENIQIIKDCIKINNPSNTKLPSTKRGTFVELLQLVTQEIFMCKNKVYQQYDGVTLGSLLGPTLANFICTR